VWSSFTAADKSVNQFLALRATGKNGKSLDAGERSARLDAMNQQEKPKNFGEFWRFYVGEHSHPLNRRLHFIGTSLGFVCLVLAAIREQPLWIPVGLLAGYGLAWAGHFFVEHNRPATFRHPLYSLLADWRMFYLTLNGRMRGEIERLGGPR
jgi:hypothetical protein